MAEDIQQQTGSDRSRLAKIRPSKVGFHKSACEIVVLIAVGYSTHGLAIWAKLAQAARTFGEMDKI